MAVKRICKYGEDILRKKIEPVNFADIKDKLPKIMADMRDTCKALRGAGLAAVQIGLELPIVIIIYEENKKFNEFFLINPEILETGDPFIDDEGCLSFPGLYAKTMRYNKIKLRTLTPEGKPVTVSAEGFVAKAIQHEIDHLNGVLFIDKLIESDKKKAEKFIKENKDEWAKLDESKPVKKTNKTPKKKAKK